ncbi:MAG: D-alanine--D-alanine ligase [Bacteroidetes bacterium]|nr:D-alanine--D-alanine ligase [Bacteroidota bacterium]
MKKNIAIAAGGDSGEFDISMKSAAVVKRNLDSELYNAYIVRMKNGLWELIDEKGNAHQIDRNDFSASPEGEKILFDCVFIAIHGTPGEDGRLLGYFDMLGIPYTSSGMVTSALTFNKYFTNNLVRSFGVRTAPSVLIHKNQRVDTEDIIRAIGLPVFVKPNMGGSSVGITKVKDEKHLKAAIDRAFQEDESVLVERFIKGREITCGVMKFNGKIIDLPITEIVSKKEFFDYEAKYTPGVADEITPALIPKYIELNCREKSLHLYKHLDCRGFVRFDYIFNDEDLFFLEVNTVPGLSENSIIPQQAQYVGISLREMFSSVLEEAMNNE